MRLINEEKLMEDIQKTITEQSGTIDWLNMIYRQPIAYNVDNVVDQLEEIRVKKTCNKEKCDAKELCRISDNGVFLCYTLRSLRNPCSILRTARIHA